MPHTILLAKVFGVFLMIIGVVVLVRRRDFETITFAREHFAHEHFVRMTMSAMRLLAGLFLVLLHNEWSSPPAAIISLLGWMMIAVSVTYLMLPKALVERLTVAINVPRLYVVGGVCAIILGVYLAVYGFRLA